MSGDDRQEEDVRRRETSDKYRMSGDDRKGIVGEDMERRDIDRGCQETIAWTTERRGTVRGC